MLCCIQRTLKIEFFQALNFLRSSDNFHRVHFLCLSTLKEIFFKVEIFRYLAKYLSFGRGRNPPQYLPWQHTCLLSLRVLGLLGLFRRQFREKGSKVEKVPFFEGKPSVKMHPGASKFFGLCLVCASGQ